MDEIMDLQRQLMAAQLQDVSHSLSHRNCVELILKMMERGDVKLFHTSSGREYVTPEQLEKEILEIITTNGGRISMIGIQKCCDVGTEHVQDMVKSIVKKNRKFQLLAGEVITSKYLDGIAQEINEKLQNSGQVEMTHLSQEFDLPATFIVDHIKAHIGTTIMGRIHQTQLYTEAFVRRLKSQIRGALHAVTLPVALKTICDTFKLDHKMAFSEVVKMVEAGEVPGALSGGQTRPVYQPAIYRVHQTAQVDQMWEKDGYVTFDRLKALQISKPKKYLEEKFPSGLMLSTCCVGEACVSQVVAAIKMCQEKCGYINIEEHVRLPPLPKETLSLFITKCIQKACGVKSGELKQMCGTFVVSNEFIEKQAKKFTSLVEGKAKAAYAESETLKAQQTTQNNYYEDASKTALGADNNNNINNNNSATGSGSKRNNKGRGERGQMRKEKKMKSKKAKKGGSNKKSAAQNLGEANAELDAADSNQFGSSSRKKMKKGGGKSKASTSSKAHRMPAVTISTGIIIDTITNSWEGRLHEDLIMELALILRVKVNAMLRESIDKLRQSTETKQRGMQDKVASALQELYDHMSMYHTSILNLRGKKEENLAEDSDLEIALKTYLLKTLGNKALDILLNNELLYMQLDLPGDAGVDLKRNFAKDRSPQERKIILAALSKRNAELHSGIKNLMLAVKSKDTGLYLTSLTVAASVCSLRLKKIDNKKLRNLAFNIRRAMMGKLEAEEDPRLVFQYTVLIVHAQMSTGLLHLPLKMTPMLLALFKDKVTPDAITAMKRAYELIENLGDDIKEGKAADSGGGEEENAMEGKLKKLRQKAKQFGIKESTIETLLNEDMDDDDLEDITEEDLIDDMGIPESQAKLVVAAISGEGPDESKSQKVEVEEAEDEKARLRKELSELVPTLKGMGKNPKDVILA